MSHENVEIVRAAWAAYARGDYDNSLAAYAENTVWDDTRYRPDGAVHRGHRAIVDVARTWRGTWENYVIEAEEVREAGEDTVAVVLRETGEGKGGGVELTNRWGIVVTVLDGRIVHTMVYPTPREALESAWLGE